MKISKENTKLGKIDNISFPPLVTCTYKIPCFKEGCYAVQSYRQYPTCRNAWDENWIQYKNNPKKFFRELKEHLTVNNLEYFRFHVAGDIPDQNYLDRVQKLVQKFKSTKFLMFTKKYWLSFEEIPDNLVIVFSAWPGHKITRIKGIPIAWMQDGTEDRIPKDAIECKKKCSSCLLCWKLKELNKDVYFLKH